MTKVIVGIPSRGDDLHYKLMYYVISLLSDGKYAVKLAISPCSVSAVMAVDALWKILKDNLGKFDYFMQIDSDIEPPENALDSMMSKDKDIVVAPIWHYDGISKEIHLNIHPNSLKERTVGINTSGCSKIYAASLGCVLMKHKVVETFITKGESPTKWSPLLTEEQRYDFNDNTFFAKAHKLGLEAWVDWDVHNVVHHRKIELSTEVLSRFIRNIQGGGNEKV